MDDKENVLGYIVGGLGAMALVMYLVMLIGMMGWAMYDMVFGTTSTA